MSCRQSRLSSYACSGVGGGSSNSSAACISGEPHVQRRSVGRHLANNDTRDSGSDSYALVFLLRIRTTSSFL